MQRQESTENTRVMLIFSVGFHTYPGICMMWVIAQYGTDNVDMRATLMDEM